MFNDFNNGLFGIDVSKPVNDTDFEETIGATRDVSKINHKQAAPEIYAEHSVAVSADRIVRSSELSFEEAKEIDFDISR